MDLSSYYQSVFYQSMDSVSCTQHSVYSVCDNTCTRQSVLETSTKFVHSCVRLREVNKLIETMRIKKHSKAKNPLKFHKTPKILYYPLGSLKIS